jgi:hypothetical protein
MCGVLGGDVGMLSKRKGRGWLTLTLGFVLGVALTVCLSGRMRDEEKSTSAQKQDVVVGGVTIRLMDIDEPNTPEAKSALGVIQGEVPFLFIYLNGDGEVISYAGGAPGHKAVHALVGREGLASLMVYGSGGTPVIFADPSEEGPGWNSIRYVETTRESGEDGRLVRYRPVGEMYVDLDGDGQFDFKDVYDDQSARLSQWILIRSNWECLGVFDPPRDWREPGYCSTSERTAIQVRDGKERQLRFEPGLGWREGSMNEQ